MRPIARRPRRHRHAGEQKHRERHVKNRVGHNANVAGNTAKERGDPPDLAENARPASHVAITLTAETGGARETRRAKILNAISCSQ